MEVGCPTTRLIVVALRCARSLLFLELLASARRDVECFCEEGTSVTLLECHPALVSLASFLVDGDTTLTMTQLRLAEELSLLSSCRAALRVIRLTPPCLPLSLNGELQAPLLLLLLLLEPTEKVLRASWLRWCMALGCVC